MGLNKVAVTGGSGRLGKYVVKELSAHYDIKVLDLVPPRDGTAFQKTDVLNPDELRSGLEGCDAVVHLAGIDLDQDTTPDAYLRVNAVGTWNVLQAACDAGAKRVVQCSSISATGLGEARKDFPPQYLPVNEDHPTAPVHPYGVSKKLQEEIARSFNHRVEIDVISLRLMLVMFDSNLDLVRDRSQDPASKWLFYYISPQDAAHAFHCALKAGELSFDTFFITAPDTCRSEPTLQWLQGQIGQLPEVRNPKTYALDPRASIFDGSRAKQALGFVAQDNWMTTCSKT